MSLKNEYKILETLHSNSSTKVHRAVRLADEKSVVLKVIKPSHRDDYKISNFINEQAILAKLNSKNIPKLLDLISTPSTYCHVFEDINANSLYNLLLSQKFTLSESLDIALALAKTVEYIHKNKIIHADINPKNIIYNIETKELQVIDFGLSIIEDEIFYTQDKSVVSSANLFYIAPEQTTMTQYEVDYRSDIYSLGMSFYHLLIGHSPLNAKNRHELIHKQIAHTPTSLHKVDKDIPQVLSDIIDKMIAKRPTLRYQSDAALIYDLTMCLKNLNILNNIPEFPIATLDKSTLEIGDSLFGRDTELELIKQSAKRAISEKPLRILISGASGLGKTRLAEELLSYFDTQKFHIIRAKSDQYKLYIPYFVFKQIFSQLEIILMKKDYLQPKQKIPQNSTELLNYLFPELKNIFKVKNKNKSYTGEEIEKHISFAVKDLLSNIANEEHPLIIFLDDLQWVGQASSSLLQKIIPDIDNPYLHFIATYRDKEINTYQKKIKFIESISDEKSNSTLNIKLSSLNKNDINNMLHSLLGREKDDIKKFSSIVYKKTGGNPLYIKNFIDYLLDHNDLYFKNGEWEYSTNKIQTYDTTIDIADLVNEKFIKLIPEEQLYLQYLALLGNHFNFRLCLDIMLFYGHKNSIMKNIIKDGFIELYSSQYQFTHDTIQKHVISSLSKESKRKIHLNIGRYLEHAYNNKDYSDIITLCAHLNLAYKSDKLPKKLFKLNIKALETMLQNSSYILALETIEWLQKNFYTQELWGKNHYTMFNYSKLQIKILYLNSKLDRAYEQVQILIQRSKSVNERISCFTLLKNICVTQGKNFHNLIYFGNKLLKELGVVVPNTADTLEFSIEKMNKKISASTLFEDPEEIQKLKQLKNIKMLRINSLLVDYWEAAYYLADVNLMKWSHLNIIDISFRYGNSSESTFGYVLYGTQLIEQNDYKKAELFGSIALKINSTIHDEAMLPKIHNFVANFINPYTKPLQTNIKLYIKSLNQSKINSDIVFGTWANFLMHFSDYLSGKSLDKLRSNIDKESDFILNSGDTKMIAIFNVLLHSLDELQYNNNDYIKDEKKYLSLWNSEKFYPALAWYAIIKAQNSFLAGDFEGGLNYLQTHVHSTDNQVIMFPKIRLHFIRALLLLGKSGELTKSESTLLSSDLSECKRYYSASPSTFKFNKLLLRVEINKHKKSTWDIAKEYDLAINEAKKIKNPFYIALGGLCASRFWEALAYKDMQRLYFNEAIVALNQWGAYSVAKNIKSKLISLAETDATNLLNSSNSSRNLSLNFQSLIESFNFISQSKDNKELINTLMKSILESATASRAVLILKESDLFFIRANMDFKEENIELLHSKLYDYPLIPNDLIHYVIDTGNKVVLQNPSETGNFQFDKYIKKYQPASSTVIPMQVEGSVDGILYLENSEIATMLSKETITILELLLTQAAIIFKNTTLYESLHANDENLNKAQELLHVGSWQFDSSNKTIIWSAETYRIFDLEPFSIDIDYNLLSTYMHPEDISYITDEVKKVFNEGSSYNVKHRIITAKGKVKFVQQRAEIYTENDIRKMSGTIQDITELQHAQDQILRLSQAIEQSPASTVITDVSGNIEYVNKQSQILTGYSSDELIGSNMSIFNSRKHPKSFFESLWKTLLDEKKIWKGTIIDKIKNNKLRDIKSTIFPILNSNNQIINFVAIQDDVTDRNIKDKLFLMQSKQAQMGEMISMIAHQWRQPLNAISSVSINLQMKLMLNSYNLTKEEDRQECFSYFNNSLEDIGNLVQNLSVTIDDFRNFYKPNKKSIVTTLENVISKALEIIKSSLINDNIEIIYNYNSQNKLYLYDNEVVQVILSILKNAQDNFKEKNVPSPQIKITTQNNMFSISDNGGGVPDEIIDQIFIPYFSTKHAMNGTGLGLYMSKIIIEEHSKGSITVENTKVGAKFIIEFSDKDVYVSK